MFVSKYDSGDDIQMQYYSIKAIPTLVFAYLVDRPVHIIYKFYKGYKDNRTENGAQKSHIVRVMDRVFSSLSYGVAGVSTPVIYLLAGVSILRNKIISFDHDE